MKAAEEGGDACETCRHALSPFSFFLSFALFYIPFALLFSHHLAQREEREFSIFKVNAC